MIVDDNLAIPESLVIIEYIEEKYGGNPKLKPSKPEDLAQMRLWMRKIDEVIHVASRTIGVCREQAYFKRKTGAD